jgi:IMP dehydrogenase|tara:strand:+ start:328 stop:1797 length:1470 start_codon:yes stop_codon:yes gene_type:complete
MKKITSMKKGYTFDDVLMVPMHSEVLPRNVDLTTMLTDDISLNIPILSAAMDTVTEVDMAKSIAREGGLGIIHKNLSIPQQVSMIEKVKRSESGIIMDPVTLTEEQTIGDAKNLMSKYSISGLPVVKGKKLIGILTNRDIRFEENHSLKVKDRMTSRNLITVPVETTLDTAKNILQKHRIEKLLVVDNSGNLKGLITVKDIQKKELYPNASKDKKGRLRVGAAVGVGEDGVERAKAIGEVGVDVIVVDTAHGHSKGVLQCVNKIKTALPHISLIAGNVATVEGTKALIDSGADSIKVGIGAGASCTTRVIAGVGVPQLTAIMDCSEEANKSNRTIIADGGLRYSGDVSKSLAGGANAVMLGSMLAGMDESPGETILYEGRQFKVYRGMGSMGAMKEGSSDRYFQENAKPSKLVPEGIEGMVPYRGPVKNTIHQLTGGLRASFGYCGAKNIGQLQKKAEFIAISNAGVRENHPHEIRIVKEAPNYRAPDI